MESGALGMQMMQNEFSAIGMRLIWNDENRIEKICQVEVALAKAQAEYGYIPEEASATIADYVNLDHIQMRKLRLDYGRTGHFVSGLVKYFEKVLPDGAGDYLHYGATTQDILDTGAVLQLREAHQDTLNRLGDLMKEVAKLARQYLDTTGAGRAHGNHAIPVNYGYKFAVYLNELMQVEDRLHGLEDFVFTSAISGAVGSYAGYGENGLAIAERAADLLDLSFDPVGWHTQRSRFVEYAHILTLLSGILGRFGKNLFDLARSELGEFEEGYAKGRQGSTAMPTMRNPYLSEAIQNLAQLTANQMNLVYQSMVVSHEKDTVAWRNLWVALPDINMYLSGQLNYLTQALKNGHFNRDRIAENLSKEKGMILSERLMLALSPDMGKSKAHQLLYDLGQEARAKGLAFEDLVRANQQVRAVLDLEDLDDLFNPQHYVGQSKQLAERIIASYELRLHA